MDDQGIKNQILGKMLRKRVVGGKKQQIDTVVTAIGGWGSLQAIEPYLNSSTSDVDNQAFEDAGLAWEIPR